MKRTIIAMLSLVFLLTCTPTASYAAPATIKLFLEGQQLSSTVAPRMVNQTTMVPIRVIADSLGVNVTWNKKSQIATLEGDKTTIVLPINGTYAIQDGKMLRLEQPPIVINGVTLLPIRFVAENLGLLVKWDASAYAVRLWRTNSDVSGSDPATDPNVPAIPPDQYPSLESIRFADHRLTIGTSGNFSPIVSTSTDPDRLVIDLPGVTFNGTISEPPENAWGEVSNISPSDPYVSAIHYRMKEADTSTIQIVADLKPNVNDQIENAGDPSKLVIRFEAKTTPNPGLKSAIYIYQSHNRESWIPELPGVTNPDFAYNATTNVAMLGARLTGVLQALGAEVYHTSYDYASIYGSQFNYGKSYVYSEKSIKNQLSLHPQIKYLFDIHRDTSPRSETTVTIRGSNYAKLYFVIGLENPNWKQNAAFAKKIQALITANYPGLSRGIYYKDSSVGNGWYNQNYSPTSALIEVGGTANTLAESNRTMDILAQAINQIRLSGQ
ncbi:stage II sporulation protein P [Paenibacillus sp. CF384]|uniref:stage II sporulation protein P n=1 Tax=Paenibacillus sp. CF384 TaxID=1884382 RepID=UPI000895CA64|nr:stage II sporulation protein P [Paenibacillus sp. CF384]SDW04400.1 stage II sporulation protein P [Paenibacillus sp. CF384]